MVDRVPVREGRVAPGAADGTAVRVDGPIHIGGIDRSGKTTMAAFLTSHPHIAVPDVGTNMWTYFYGRFGDLDRTENLERCMVAMLRYTHVRCLQPDPERIVREFREGPTTYARLFALFLSHYAEQRGKRRWGVQTGLIERYADRLFESYAGVRVIHMVRDPRDRYEASISLWPSGKGRAGGATARWRYSMRLAERNARRYPKGYLVVRYEDLVTQTERTLRGVCDFLGEDFHPEMLSMSHAPERRERLSARSGAGPDEPPLSAEFIGRFRDRVPPPDIAFIQLHAGRMMRAYGYEPDPLPLRAGDWARFGVLDWPGQVGRMAAWRTVETLGRRFPSRFGPTPDPKTLVDEPGDPR